jgi:hypothetical protein
VQRRAINNSRNPRGRKSNLISIAESEDEKLVKVRVIFSIVLKSVLKVNLKSSCYNRFVEDEILLLK